MPSDYTPSSLENCTLWKRLNEPFGDEAKERTARALAHSLGEVCKLACDRMKLMPALHAEFTLHDETHLLRVTELMARVIPPDVLHNVLNPIEISLLILAAHFHDVGMIPDSDELADIKRNDDFSLFRENWLVEYPSFRDALSTASDRGAKATDKHLSDRIVAEHEMAVLQSYLRKNHAQRSAEFVKQRLGADDRLRIGTGHLADSVALLCTSHNTPPDHLTETEGFIWDKAIGTFSVNLQYLAIVLRLADILDFDRERTPSELYRCINFTNPISIIEWEKHRSVEGWKIGRDAVRFECACKRPEYELAIRRFMDSVDSELAAAHEMVHRFPAQFSSYKFDLPTRTDRSRISPKDGAYIQASDLEITLSRDEIIRLLMTEKLYGHPSLAIRELLQNAWDALRHRAAIMKRDEQMDWTLGSVEFEHGVNADGREYVRCVDNGVGMDQHVLKNFLVRAGRSYYRSPEFERERLTFRQKNTDFDPCARFGIGFMSVFMLGDQITIKTRRYRGQNGGLGESLIVEINGIGGLIVLRRGAADQPAGTTIEIIGRRKPDRFLSHQDRVRLVDTIYAFALAGEFPVNARCTIPEIKDDIELPAGVAREWHPFVEYGVQKCAVFTQNFNEIDARLSGAMITAVPLSEEGRLVVVNDECGWQLSKDKSGPSYWVDAAEKPTFFGWEGRTCMDGILVAGPQGRGLKGYPIVGGQFRNPINFGNDLFVLDVRGELKPELTPHRSPPAHRGLFRDGGPTWQRLRRYVGKAHGILWEQVIERFANPADIKALWQLLALHHVNLSTLRRGLIWDKLTIPSIKPSGELFFRPFSEIMDIPFNASDQKTFAPDSEGTVIGVDDEMSAWVTSNETEMVIYTVEMAVLGMATLILKTDAPALTFSQPCDMNEMALSRIILDHHEQSLASVPFGQGLENVLAVEGAKRLLNQHHPVVEWLLAHQEYSDENPHFAFIHTLAGALLEEGAMDALAAQVLDERRHNWHFSMLGYLYRHTDLSELESNLRPPYVCWHPRHGKFEVTAEVLERLAEIQAIDWHRREEKRYI